MKNVALALLLSGSFSLQAQEPLTLDQIIAKREALLSSICEMLKARTGGDRDPREIFTATLQLNEFRRDSAKTTAQKIAWQEQIVALEKSEVKDVKSRMAVGVMTPLDLARAEERVLAAEQRLLELQQAK